jgi:hypothetical protein
MTKQLIPRPVRAIASEFPPVTGTGAVTEQSAIEAAKNKEVISTATAEPEQVLPEQKDPIVTLSTSQLETMLKTAIASVTDDVTKKVEGKFEIDIKTLQTELDKAKSDLADAQNQKAAIANVFTALGHSHPVSDKAGVSMPGVNTLLASDRDRETGLFKDFVECVSKADSKLYTNQLRGIQYLQRDTSTIDSFFLRHKADLRQEMEAMVKKHGFLRGLTDKAAATARTDILPALLDYLSAFMRTTHSGTYVFWQFAFKNLELGKGPGDTIQVPRDRDIPPATDVATNLMPLAGPGATRQEYIVDSVTLTLQRRGLTVPVSIPQFLSAYSMIPLENRVMKKLGKHQEADLDLCIRTRLLATTRVVYNDNGSVTTNPLDVNAGDNGALSESFLNALYAYMTGALNIDTDAMGCLILVGNPLSLVPLVNSLTSNNRNTEKMSVEYLTDMLTQVTNADAPTVSGYMLSACGFHLFQSTAYAGGASGTEGVFTTTFGDGAKTTRACIAMGFYAVANAVGMEPEMRRANEDNFQMVDDWIWTADRIVGDLDVDPVIDPEQQLRVVEVRVTDTPF